jgi:Uma2 family endonuclease
VTIVAGSKPQGKIIRTPPHVAVEVLSPDDRAGDLEEKIADYLAFGVPYVWVVNPETRRAYIHTAEGNRESKDGLLRAENPKIEVPLAKLFGT